MQARAVRKSPIPYATHAALRALPGYFLQPVRLLRAYQGKDLRADVVAGITVGVVALPQGIAFALLAGLPAEMGIYTSIVAAMVGALWGSSNQLSSGPTNNAALLVFSILLPLAVPGSALYISAAGLLAVLAGLLRLLMGLARLGVLINFVSDSVIVGFTAGAGILIIIGQLRSLLGLNFTNSPYLIETLGHLAANLGHIHLLSALTGLGTIVVTLLAKRINKALPAPLLAMIIAALAVALFKLDERDVLVLAALRRSLPPLTPLPLFNWELVGDLSTGALAVAAIGLVEAMSIARAFAAQTGQRLDSNQEFVGQGLANIASGFLGGFAASGSFNRSALSFEAGARTPLAGALSGVVVLVVIWLFAPLAVFVPLPAIAALLVVSAYSMINRREMVRIWQGSHGDRFIMLATLGAALLLPLQFAVLTGVLMSLIYYIWRTSMPRVYAVVPDTQFKYLVPQLTAEGEERRPTCPQLSILEIEGDLYFGAAPNVEEVISHTREQHPGQRFLLLLMTSVDQIDISGIHMLESVVRSYRETNGDVFLVRVHEPIFKFMQATGFVQRLGADHFLEEDTAIGHLFYRVLDPAVCIYECDVKVFRECQNLPKQTLPPELTLAALLPGNQRASTAQISPQQLWQQMHSSTPPLVIDVREPREFQRAHIPSARSYPLLQILSGATPAAPDDHLVLVCRSGRRSARAAQALAARGFAHLTVLEGGLAAWEAADLLEAVDLPRSV
ncbi:MAG: SulP family inorganic anion transporter [Caldilineales bacterium]